MSIFRCLSFTKHKGGPLAGISLSLLNFFMNKSFKDNKVCPQKMYLLQYSQINGLKQTQSANFVFVSLKVSNVIQGNSS